jgi:hypothetical protein
MLSAIVVARGDDSRTNKWQMQVGWVHQWGRGMSVSGPAPSISARDLSSAPLGGSTLLSGVPTPSIPLTGFINRDFNDGYVHPDIFTGDTGLLSTDPERYGMTWNWGANNTSGSQYNYPNNDHPTLSFHVNDREAVLGAATVTGSTTDDELPTEGLEIKFSRRLCTWTNSNLNADGPLTWTNGNITLDLVLGLVLFPQVSQHVARQASLGVYSVNETYTYFDYYGSSAGGGYPPLTFPYAGTFGSYYGPAAGPLIPELPESWTYGPGSLLGTARDCVAIDSEIWRLRGEIGLTLTKEITQRLSAYVSPQFVLEFVDMRACRHETLTYTDAQAGGTTTVFSRTDSKQKMTLVPGFLLTGGVDYLLSENWFVGASLGWEWLARNPSIRVGPDRVHFDLDGGEFSLYLGRHF